MCLFWAACRWPSPARPCWAGGSSARWTGRCTASPISARRGSPSVWWSSRRPAPGADYLGGWTQQIMQLREWLRGRTEWGSGAFMLGMGHYRLFIIALCATLTVGLQYLLARTRWGSRLRAAVDDQRVAAGLGIDVNLVFLSTFAIGSGLAGLGGALGAEM